MNLPDAPTAHEGFFAAHFFTVSDQDKSKDFYVRILGGKLIEPDNPCYIKLANTWIILNSGGGPTPDKPQVLLETPSHLNRVSSFLTLRVADIWACYKQSSDFATACWSLRSLRIDMVLSNTHLSDGTGFGLLGVVAGLPVTMFLCLPVETSCFWLPAIDAGRNCLGLPALRPSEFEGALEQKTRCRAVENRSAHV